MKLPGIDWDENKNAINKAKHSGLSFEAAQQPVALVGFYDFFVEKIIKTHDYPACANLRFDGSLQGKKSPNRRFLEVLCAKRNKLPVCFYRPLTDRAPG
jgi:hypothetical protein